MSATVGAKTESWFRDALPRETDLHGYKLVALLGRGGFGITYRAVDAIDQVFAIKECYPKQFVIREGINVVPSSEDDVEIVASCLDRFTKEARALTLFSKSGAVVDGVVKVVTYFQANNTAYIVMEFVEGEGFDKLIAANPSGLPEETLLPIMRNLLTALASVHDHGLLHRDIKPANILLRKNGRPALLDFGAARERASGSVTSYAIFSESYAPLEQIACQEQGPYSDLFSLGMTCYQAIAGSKFRGTPTSTERAAQAAHGNDPLVPAVTLGEGRYSEWLLSAIDALLKVRPEDRPQNVDEFLPLLEGNYGEETILAERATRIARTKTPDTADSDATVIAARTVRSAAATRRDTTRLPPTTAAPPIEPAVTAPGRSSLAPILAIFLGLALVAAAGTYLYGKSPELLNKLREARLIPGTEASPTIQTAPPPPPVSPSPTATRADADAAYQRGDYAAALRDYTAIAKSNDPQAQYQLGYMYQLGQGVAQDYGSAAHWYQLAADQGHREAQLQLGSMAHNGIGMVRDYAAAMHWYKLAADQGSVAAENQIGYLYQMGSGVPVDYAEAMRWYRSAADQGSAPAQVRIGRFYEEGLGVPKDLSQAKEWMTRAAARGNPDAREWLETHK